jgi:hypothetical protein
MKERNQQVEEEGRGVRDKEKGSRERDPFTFWRCPGWPNLLF